MIGRITEFWGIIRELNVQELERDLTRPLLVRVSASDPKLLDQVVGLVFAGDEASVRRAALQGETWAGFTDLEVLVVPGTRPASQAEVTTGHALLARGAPAVLVIVREHLEASDGIHPEGMPEFPAEHVVAIPLADESRARALLAQVVLEAAPNLRLVLGRRFPAFRTLVAEHLIRETSAANAQFALMSSVPAVLPIVGGLVGTMADTLVLTKNQALLLLKLAGVYGRDLSDKTRLLAEIAPVVGGAFAWRSLARNLMGMLPGPAALVPKTAVAYIGTYTVGQMARYYYDVGKRPSSALVRSMTAKGSELFRRAAQRLKPPAGPGDNP
jgi:uncharacterized protein (DUF697 family)